MASNYVLIPCEVSPGQFSGEVAVTIHLSGGKIVSLFADKSLIEKKGGRNFLKTTEISSPPKNRKHGEQIVILPTETFENGSRWLRKTGDLLVAA